MFKKILLKVSEKINLKKARGFNFKNFYKFSPILLILIIIGLVLPRGFVNAGIAELLGNVPFMIMYAVFFILFEVARLIAIIGATILNISLNPAIMNVIFSSPAIYQGWQIIRDICNLLFLLLMLLVAFGTIVQSSKYNIKNSLPKLIVTIFLINFSNVIAGVIIDFGNILMYGILKWICVTELTCFEGITGGLLSVVDRFSETFSFAASISWDGIDAKQAIGLAIATVYTFIFGFILMALAAFLLVRTAGLALLLILSPFAYFGEIMPGMEKIAHKWWNNIWSYSLFGPIFALMLYISGEMAKITIAVPPFADPELGSYGPILTLIISNLLPLFFLMAIIPVTRELGLAGTDTIIKNTAGLGDKIGVGAVKYVGNVADRYAARGAKPGMHPVRRALSNLSPGAWKRAARNMRGEQEHDFDIAAGSHWNKLEKIPGGNKNVDHKQISIDREVARVISTLSENIAALDLTNQKALKDKDAILIEASLKKLSTSGDTGVALRSAGFVDTRQGLSDYMQKVKSHLGKERSEILAEEIGYAEDKDGNSGFIGFRKYDKDGKTRLLDFNDKTYRDDDGNEYNFKDEKGNTVTPEQHEELKKDEKWSKKWKTDKEWQQEAVNKKLAGKSSFPRNTKLKANTLLDQEISEDGKPISGKYKLGEQGVEYFNTIGEKNLDDVSRGIKKEMERERNALYEYAKKHSKNKWNKLEEGLTKMERKHLIELEKAVGKGDNRPDSAISKGEKWEPITVGVGNVENEVTQKEKERKEKEESVQEDEMSGH